MLPNNMAMPNGTISFGPKPQIEAVQTVLPVKPTDPRRSRQVSIAKNLGLGIFRRRLHIVLYYNKASEEDSGWLVAGWMKESIGSALLEQPMLAGRLRRGEERERGLEIVSNDGGVRLVEAQFSMNMVEFLNLKERREAEAELVFWEDIDEQNPQFSPLTYIQVTNFKCGGYSIGISCSLLLADPTGMTSFLRKWAKIHNNMVSKSNIPKIPIFYLPNLRKTGYSPTNPNGSIPSKNSGQTFIFKIASKNLNLENEMQKTILALLCIEEAEHKLGIKMASNFSLLEKKPSNDMIMVQNCSKKGLVTNPSSITSGLTCASWDELGADEIILNEGNKPTCVSYWIHSEFDVGLVMLYPSPDEGTLGMNIMVTIPHNVI